VLASYLRRVRGAAADPDRIIICSGFAQGAGLVLRALAREGVDSLALEEPGSVEDASVAHRWEMEPVAVPVDEEGILVEPLAASGARAAVLTPAHHFPTVSGEGRRRAPRP
jgi:GntR family transcriptional regulator / MocR family aminotransferase